MCLCSRCNWGMDTALHVKALSLTVVLHKTSYLNSYNYEHDLCSWQRTQAMLVGCQENVRPPAESLQLSAPSSLNHWGVSIKTKFPQILSGKLFLKRTSFGPHTRLGHTFLWAANEGGLSQRIIWRGSCQRDWLQPFLSTYLWYLGSMQESSE